MTAIEITYRYVENNTHAERSGVCRGLSEEGAVAIAVERLDATELDSGDFIYFARETRAHYVVTREELLPLGAAVHVASGSDYYSLWCQDAGREATDAEIEEVAS